MKKLFNSSSLLVGLILIFVGVLANRKTIDGSTEKAIANVLFKNNYAEQWLVKPNSIHDGDTLRVIKENKELKIRLCGIDAPEIKQPLGIESRDYLRSEAMPKAYRLSLKATVRSTFYLLKRIDMGAL